MKRIALLVFCAIGLLALGVARAEGAGVGETITNASKKASAAGNKVVKKTTDVLKRAGNKTAEVMNKAGHKTGQALNKATEKLRN